MNLVAVFYHESQDIPTVIRISMFSKFLEHCEAVPTTWAYLYNKDTGEVLDTYKYNKYSEN
jgi:hypothetical protein